MSTQQRFADALRLLPIGGDVTDEMAAFDRSLLVLVKQAQAVDAARHEGMWRTWKLEALVDAETEARSAASVALSTLPPDRPELRAAVELRCAGLETFLARYPARRPA